VSAVQPSTCNGFLGAGTPYTTPILATGGALAGCARSPIGSCPFGYISVYNGAVITGCLAATTCSGGLLSIYDATGNLIGCANNCALFQVSNVVLKNNAGTVVGCMSPAAVLCPDGFAYSVYVAGSGRAPGLSECYTTSVGAPACSAVPVYNNVGKQTQIGW
jgi:hypothetical protein